MNAGKESTRFQRQQASRMASRGEHKTLFHLLFPIAMMLSFALFYLAPLVAARYVESAALADFIEIYLDWSVFVATAATLISYHKARQRMLRPYLKQINEPLSESCREP